VENIQKKAPEEIKQALKEQKISINQAYQTIRKQEQRLERVENIIEISKNNEPLSDIKQKFPVIYADPAWQYDYSVSDSRKIENQYPTMPLEDIKNMEVESISADDCILFMWTTSPKLKDSFEVLSSWGFQYKTCAIWDKKKIGMGYYFRQQHELLLVATKGNIPTPIPENRPSSIFGFERGDHSSKPHEVYEMIEKMYPEFAKIELFCRTPRSGWTAWGNQS
jgi:N6-adenosine-specific RNA methylase IME4